MVLVLKVLNIIYLYNNWMKIYILIFIYVYFWVKERNFFYMIVFCWLLFKLFYVSFGLLKGYVLINWYIIYCMVDGIFVS